MIYLYVAIGVLLFSVANIAWYRGHEIDRLKSEIVVMQQAEKDYAAKREQEIKDATHVHDQELTDLRAYRESHPVVPVRLCKRPAPVPSPATAGTASSPATGTVQPLPAGDNGTSGPDIGPLLDALAASADSVSADLRAQQAVR